VPHPGHAADESWVLHWTCTNLPVSTTFFYKHAGQVRQQNISNIMNARREASQKPHHGAIRHAGQHLHGNVPESVFIRRRQSADTSSMTSAAEIARDLEHTGYTVIPGRMDDKDLAAARKELVRLLASADWGSGFDGNRTKRAWALLARTRCMDKAALDPLVLEAVEQTIGTGTQFSLT
jgi:hypothetical protein